MCSSACSQLPAVDVVVCTHNRPELLRVAVASILNQDYAGFLRVIVVFDRTEPDMTLEALDGSMREVTVITNTRSGGLAGARNSGVLAGSGDLVAFCDDDDQWEMSKLSCQVDALRRSSALTCVTGIRIDFQDRSSVRLARADEMTYENLVRHRVMPAHPSSVLVRRTALVGAIGLVDEEIPGSYAEDYDWILRAAQAGTICVVEEPLVRVMWGQSLFSDRWATIIEALDYLVDKFPQFRSDRRALSRIRGQQAFGYAALGDRRRALRVAWEALRLNPLEKRGYITVPTALGLVQARRVMELLHRRGRGI